MNVFNRIGVIEGYHYKNYIRATKYFEQQLTLARETGNLDRQAAALTNIGGLASFQDNWDKAIKYTQEALELVRMYGNTIGICVASGNLAEYYIAIGFPEKANPFIKESLLMARKSASTANQLYILTVVARKAFAAKDIHRALRLSGFLYNQPAASSDAKRAIDEDLLPKLRESLSEKQIQAGMEAGKDLDLDTVIDGVLSEQGEST
jgi:tetratricopeptide (TPR) repeat protein